MGTPKILIFGESGGTSCPFIKRSGINKCTLVAEREGEMLEWLKRHAWKACKLQKGFRGSNPRLSAKVLHRAGDESSLADTE